MQKSDWKKCKLGDVAEITSSKRIFLADYVAGGVPFYRSKEIIERSAGKEISNPLFISNEKYQQIVNKFGAPQYGEMLLTSVGTLGIPYRVSQTDKFYFKDGNLTWFRKLKDISCDYLYYFFLSPIGKEKLETITIGSTQKALTIKALQNLDISLPSMDEQKRIAQILGALDDKIELLQKQNKTLEDMAKAIFKSWFVDFDVVHAKQKGLPKADIMREYHLTDELYDLFPSDFENSSLGPIPLGWQVKKIGELVSVVRGGSPRPIQKFLAKEGLPWLKISDATASPTKFITHIEQCIIPEGLSKTRFIKKGSLVVSNSATPGMPKFLALDTCIHDGWLFLDDYKGITKELLYYFILFNRAELVALGSGSVFTNLKTDVLKNFQIVVPTEIIQNKLNPIFAQIDEAILLHNKQIQTLTELRDTLLPPLISGKIRV